MKKLLALLFILLLIPIVLAVDSSDPFSFVNNPSMPDNEKVLSIKQIIAYQLPQMKDDFNANSSLPGPVSFLLNNEKINIVSENLTIGLLFKDGKIDSLEAESFSKPDFNVYISDKFLLELHQEKADFKQSIKDGDIRFEGLGIINKLKLAPIKLLLKVL